MIPIVGALKNYAWGLAGRDSLAAALHASNARVAVDSEEPAAELWLGTHTSGPSTTRDGGLLRDAVGTDLPFLLKVLSVARPLSIQAHPDKTLAEKLHSERPDKYKDDNHKPEMAVALTRKYFYLTRLRLSDTEQHSRACATFANRLLLQLHSNRYLHYLRSSVSSQLTQVRKKCVLCLAR